MVGMTFMYDSALLKVPRPPLLYVEGSARSTRHHERGVQKINSCVRTPQTPVLTAVGSKLGLKGLAETTQPWSQH